MHCTCVRQTELPHTTALAADLYYNPDKLTAFYRHPLRDLESFRSAAAEIHFPDDRRAALVAALRKLNPGSPALARLAEPGALVVATGQQVGLFSGPAYTIFKALHAARLAEWLTANGIPAVPVRPVRGMFRPLRSGLLRILSGDSPCATCHTISPLLRSMALICP